MIGISSLPDGSIDFNFLTGVINLPAQQGVYVIAGGCGSGKTSNIKSLIRQRYQDGILYAVDTIEALNDVYRYIQDTLILPGILKELEVIKITSETDIASKQAYQEYCEHPDWLPQKKIILCTHTRFFNSLINFFLIYRTPLTQTDYFDGDFASLLSRNDLRKWIIFDETPQFIRPFVSMPYHLLAAFSETRPDGTIGCRSDAEMKRYYNQFIKNTPVDFLSHGKPIDRIKEHVVFSLIAKRYTSWIGAVDKSKNVEIYFKPTDLQQDVVNSHVLFFEGAGDVLLKTCPFQMLDTKQKYNSRIDWKMFNFTMKRSKSTYGDRNYMDMLDQVNGIIHSHMAHKQQVLLVVWKGIGDGNDEGSNESAYAEKVKMDLIGRGCRYFHTTYFGSNLTKSTNLFRNYKAIILCGNWNVPNTDNKKLRENWGVKTSIAQQKLWIYVQLITRIGIRNHNKGIYTVYYSSDYPKSDITALQTYFNNAYRGRTSKKGMWKDVVADKRLNTKTRTNILAIGSIKADLGDAIIRAQTSPVRIPYSIRRTELQNILPQAKEHPKRTEAALKIGFDALNIEFIATK